jgi:hypothetical protein
LASIASELEVDESEKEGEVILFFKLFFGNLKLKFSDFKNKLFFAF